AAMRPTSPDPPDSASPAWPAADLRQGPVPPRSPSKASASEHVFSSLASLFARRPAVDGDDAHLRFVGGPWSCADSMINNERQKPLPIGRIPDKRKDRRKRQRSLPWPTARPSRFSI